MLGYGLLHHKGFTPKKIPYKSQLTKHQGKTFFVNNKNNIPVPARPFIFPDKEALKRVENFIIHDIKEKLKTTMHTIFKMRSFI